MKIQIKPTISKSRDAGKSKQKHDEPLQIGVDAFVDGVQPFIRFGIQGLPALELLLIHILALFSIPLEINQRSERKLDRESPPTGSPFLSGLHAEAEYNGYEYERRAYSLASSASSLREARIKR